MEEAFRAAEQEPVASLDVSAFGASDLVRLILQRSEIIRDQPRPNAAIRAWIAGDDGPLQALADRLGEVLVRRAAAVIWLEYLALRPVVERLAPRRIADIGCGYALIDLFLARDFGADLVLIDLEDVPERHFGFAATGAAYSSLSTARRFLVANGVPAPRIVTRNPAAEGLGDLSDMDLAISLISCGYHYPWQTYDGFFRTAMRPGASVVLDLRRRIAARARTEMAALGETLALGSAAGGSAERVLLALSPGLHEARQLRHA